MEAKNEAKAMAAQQFAYYGMNQVNDETLENYAQSILGNKEENRKIYDRLFERKVIDAVTPQITVVEKEISADDFGKLAQEAQEAPEHSLTAKKRGVSREAPLFH